MMPESTSGEQLSRRAVRECFGGGLYQQGRAFYVALEFLAILRGQLLNANRILEPGGPMGPYWREAHETARAFATQSERTIGLDLSRIDGAAMRSLEGLFSSITLDIPGRRKQPDWTSVHLYPYVGELIHYDAVTRRGLSKIERYTYRGGGGLAHEIIRTDPDRTRLDATRVGLTSLVSNSNSPLGRLAQSMKSFDNAHEESPFNGKSDGRINAEDPASSWTSLLRRGVHNIVTRDASTEAQKVENLMHWVPYCIARHQHEVAIGRLPNHETRKIALPVDFGDKASALRTASRASFERARWEVFNGLKAYVASWKDQTEDALLKRQLALLLEGSQSWAASSRAFYSETLAGVGALNSTVGKRHFTFSQALLEAATNALLAPGEERELDDFTTNLLFNQLGLVVDVASAEEAGFAEEIDLSEFRQNSERCAAVLKSLGLLSEYSDATRMVHAEVSN